MKKLLLSIVLLFSLITRSFADEGMWLPMLLGQQVYNEMVKKGLKLTKDQLYNINQASLKDAIVIFGSGCTGEVVSAEGLLFTNHHCGYDAIAAASTVEHNILKDGFYAADKGEEIPTSISVQFLVRVEDVTKEVMDSLGTLSGLERWQKQSTVLAAINKRMTDPTLQIDTRVSAMFKGIQFLAFVYQRYSDVRLVGAPPESVGKFGGDTDNWEWPRHNGDYAIYRVYTGADGKAAKYDAANVPLKPKWFLPISLKGYKENDFAMVWGYPGSTNRYETSFGVKLATDINNPTLVELRDVRLKYMMDEMKKSEAIKLQLSPNYAMVANYWKFFDGETKQLLKHDIYGVKKKEEEAFTKWADGKPEYQGILAEWSDIYTAWRKYAKHRVYINEGIFGSSLFDFAIMLKPVETALVKTNVSQAELKRALAGADYQRTSYLKELNKTSDQNIIAAVVKMFYDNVPKDQHPIGIYGTIRNQYGALDKEETYKKLAADILSKTFLFDDAKWKAFMEHPDANALQADPAYYYATAFYNNYITKYAPYYQQFNAKNLDLGRLYLKGLMEMNPVKAKMMYPDATFTMRVSYGTVKAYRPRDGVFYDYVTTSKGILEKYIPGDYEFDLPAKQIELFRKKDFGQYADPVRKDLVIGFITNNDITGGNSGSPVLNANGELLGLAFDGNYEALSNRIVYDKDLNRTICVDIRYVLWCIDKLGGASNIIKELKLVR